MNNELNNIEKIIISLLILNKLDFNKYKIEPYMFIDKDYSNYIKFLYTNKTSSQPNKDINQSFLSYETNFTKKILNFNEIDNVLNVFNEVTLIEILYKENISRNIQLSFKKNISNGQNTIELIEKNLEETRILLKNLYAEKVEVDIVSTYRNYLAKTIIKSDSNLGSLNMSGLSSGFYEYDLITRGLKTAEYILLGARPSMGKTSLGLDVIAKNVLDGKNAIIFSVETPTEQIMARLLCKVNPRLTLNNTLHGDDYALKEEEINNALYLIQKSNLRIYDFKGEGAVTPSVLKKKCEEYRDTIGEIDIVLLDYIQLLESESRIIDENVKIATISRDIALLMKDFSAPWIVLSQLNRDLEKRDDKRPKLSDLRNSGALEQDADLIIFLYKENVYLMHELKAKIAKNPNDRNSSEALNALIHLKEDVAEANIAKNRNGPLGTVNLIFTKDKASFYDKNARQVFSNVEEDDIF